MTRAELALIRALRSPAAVQAWLNDLDYNVEHGGETLRSFRGVVRTQSAHCLEAALFAAVVLEQHGYPPLVMSLESQDNLDHVIFVHRKHGRWGSVARSRDPGLNGRKPVFRDHPRAGLQLCRALRRLHRPRPRLRRGQPGTAMGSYDWRWSERNVWKVEQVLIDWPHVKLPSSTARYRQLKSWYRAVPREATADRKPVDYRGREMWSPLPDEFLA